MMMTLAGFLARANKARYASGLEPKKLPDGRRIYRYEELDHLLGHLVYVDEYRGFNPFFGWVTIWVDNVERFCMIYMGKVLSDEVDPKLVYEFLQKALQQATEEQPYRGPEGYQEGDFEYINNYYGSEEDFFGDEIIKYCGSTVYQLEYQGGLMDS